MKPVSPRLTLYLAQKGDSEFHPVMLQEVTVSELLKNISDIVEVSNALEHYSVSHEMSSLVRKVRRCTILVSWEKLF